MAGQNPDKEPTEIMQHYAKTTSSDQHVSSSRLEMPAILQQIDPQQRAQLNKDVRKKIDRRLLPMVMLMYVMNYIDR